jgi:hypothetical protein
MSLDRFSERIRNTLAETVTAVMITRQMAVAAFHARTAALEQIGTARGDRLDLRAARGCQGL